MVKGYKNRRTMMVLYRSPQYQAVKVDNEDKYQSSTPSSFREEEF